MLRRSGRWAKKVNDVINAETPEPTKGLNFNEMSKKEMLKCPCCDFLAAFESVRQDHYIAHHKVPNKNACLVCHLKFEATQNFLDHFADHASGKLTNEAFVDINEGNSNSGKFDSNAGSGKVAAVESSLPTGAMISMDKESFLGVVKNISEAKVSDTTYDNTKFVRIPYQAAIQDKNMKDSKLKKFEDLKAPNDIVEMVKYENIKNFFKCILYNCTYSTQNHDEYTIHLKQMHSAKRLHCCYCIKEYFSGDALTEHLISEHSKRLYQCSKCFYRAYSKIHVQIHIKNVHPTDVNIATIVCDGVEVPSNITVKDETNEVQNTTWPYVCAIGECNFQTFDPKDFRSHNESAHRSVSVFFCHYCKVDFLSFKRLLNHYRLHGINTFQCNYCIHGSETKDEILLHLCNVHPDRPLQAFMRGSEEDVSTEAKNLPFSFQSEKENTGALSNSNSPRPESPNVEIDIKNRIDFESLMYEVIGETYYPKLLRTVCSDFTCGVQFCRDRFEHISSYVGHLKNTHAVTNFPCPHCPEISDSWYAFKNHLMCHGPELYSCGLVTCDFYDWNKHVVTDHLKSHSNSAAKVTILRERNVNEKDESDIDMLKTLPKECPFNVGSVCYQCFFCRYKSSDKTIMKKHLYDEFAYRKISCVSCDERFGSRKEMKDHALKLHPKQELECTIDSNIHIENLVDYLLNNSVDSTNNKCSLCLKNFKSAVHFHSHVRLCVQNSYKPYHCDYCMQSFSDLKILKYHVDENHFPKHTVLYEMSSNLIEQEISLKLQQVRSKYVREVLGNDAPSTDRVTFVKSYLCGLCSFESNHKYNVEVHCIKEHIGSTVEIKKELRNKKIAELETSADENSNDNSKMSEAKNNVRRYRCGFCNKKLYSVVELENHVESLHPLHTEIEYHYFFLPDTTKGLSSADTDLYECAYCKSGKENLHSLKTHHDLMHSEAQFKVRGKVVKNGEGSASCLACAYCYQLVDTLVELKQHTAADHPSVPQKSIGGFRSRQSKRSNESDDEEDILNKRVRFGGQIFVCASCGLALTSHEVVTAHFRKAHPKVKVEFTAMNGASGDNLPRFYKCEFCQFVSEQRHLEAHLNAKHKSRVRCEHCGKRFEFATKLRQHHDSAHKDLPLKYSQETIGQGLKKRESLSSAGRRPSEDYKTLDFNFVYVLKENSDGSFTKMSVVEFSKKCNIYPKVKLERCKQL